MSELALVGLGITASAYMHVGGIRTSLMATIVAMLCLWTRYCMRTRPLHLQTGGLFLSTMLIFVGGLAATAAVGGGRGDISTGAQALLVGMGLTILIIWVAGNLEVDCRYALVGVVLGAFLNASIMVYDPRYNATGRVVGYNHPNLTGFVMVLAIFSMLYIRSSLPFLWMRSRYVQAAVVLLLIYCINLTGSRSAAISLFVGMTWLAFGVRRTFTARVKFVAAVLLLSGGVLLFATNTPLFARVGSDNAQSSDSQREGRLSNQFEMARESPLFGSGFTNLTVAHNVPLQVWATGGLLGLSGLVVLLVALIRELRITRRSADPPTQVVGAMIAAVLAVWVIQPTLSNQIIWVAVTAAMVCRRAAIAPVETEVERAGSPSPHGVAPSELRPYLRGAHS